MNKKSQIKMFETIAVLVVFFFILAVGLVFYSSVERKSIGRTQEEFSQLKGVETAQLISYMPELECVSSLETENCVDLYKILAIENNIFNTNKEYYYDFFGYSTITVYDLDNDYLVYDNPKQGSSSRIRIPVLIYDPILKIKKFGVLNITIY